jgi:hypothetical protein
MKFFRIAGYTLSDQKREWRNNGRVEVEPVDEALRRYKSN